jgi:protein-S-isoprenylcysteine O-methyltransferase Ste14
MMEKGINAYLVFAIATIASVVAALFAWPYGLYLVVMNTGALVAETIIFKFTRPEIFKRRISMENWWDRLMTPLIAIAAVASVAFSAYDYAVVRVSLLPGFTFLVGLVILMGAYLVVTQSLRANAPHAEEKYGEEAVEDHERGPYEVVRHPMMLSVLLGGIAMPLILGSGIGFIPVAVMVIAIVVRVAAEDEWRFNNYEWYYDYTKEVSYRLIPFIW